jgi:hypothetical protein
MHCWGNVQYSIAGFPPLPIMPTGTLRTICLLLALVGRLPCAHAGEAAGVYTVPVAPWTFPDQPDRGVAAEYLRYLFDTAGIPARLGTLPYQRVFNGLRDGSNAAAILIPDAERDGFALRLCQVTTIRSGVLYKKARFKKTPDLATFSGLTVGIPHGTHALNKLEMVPGVKAHSIESVEQGLKMLQIDRLDASFLSSPGSDIVLRDSGLPREEYGWLEVDVSPVVVYISRKAALAQDGAAMQRLKNVCTGSGQAVMDELMRKYR